MVDIIELDNKKKIYLFLKKPEALISSILFLILIGLEGTHYFFSELLPFENLVKMSLLILISAMSTSIYHSISESISNKELANGLSNRINGLQKIVEETRKEVPSSLKSFYDECMSKYTRDELIGLLMTCTQKLNQFEYIDDEIYKLYQEHGLLELANEPQKSKFKLIFNTETREIEKDKIVLNIIQDFRLTNEAKKGGSNKKVNANGLVAFFSRDLTISDWTKLSDEIAKHLQTSIRFTASFPIFNSHYENRELVPDFFIPAEDFDYERIRKKGDNEIKSKPILYAVYKVSKLEDYNLLNIGLYLDVEIPPEEYINLYIVTKEIVPDFYLWTYEFISWTNGIDFELELGDEFETDIGYMIPGEKPSIMTRTKFKYNGWIMPHSTISMVWRRKNI
jgi:hypothetical protein